MASDRVPTSGEEFFISSTLRWENVVLPASVSETDLDQLILASLRPQFRKTARVIGDVFNECEARSWPIDVEVLSARIQALAEAGTIEGEGDLRAWRHSEVRLTGE